MKGISNLIEIVGNKTLNDYCGILQIMKVKDSGLKIQENSFNPTIADLKEGYCSASLFDTRPLNIAFFGFAYNYQDPCTEMDTSLLPYKIRVSFIVDGNIKSERVYEDTKSMSIEMEELLTGSMFSIKITM